MKVIEDRTTLSTSGVNVPSVLVGLESDPSTAAEDKYERARAMYAKWKHEDIDEAFFFFFFLEKSPINEGGRSNYTVNKLTVLNAAAKPRHPQTDWDQVFGTYTYGVCMIDGT